MDSGVNFTAGLSVIRRRRHMAQPMIWQGKHGFEDSFRQAIYTACDIYQNRMINKEITANPLKVEKRAEQTR